MIPRFAGSIALVLALAGAAHAQQPAPPQKLTGMAAWSALVGNTVNGKVDGKEYTEYYVSDGSVKALQDSKRTTGRWALEGLNVCFLYKGDPKRCYTVEVIDKVATFTGRDGAYRVNILPGNAKNL